MAAGPINAQPMDNRLRIAQATIIKDLKIKMGIDVLSYEARMEREGEYLRRMTEAMDRIQGMDTNKEPGMIPTIDISNEPYHNRKEENQVDTDDEIDRMIAEEEAEEEMRRMMEEDEEEEVDERVDYGEKGAQEA